MDSSKDSKSGQLSEVLSLLNRSENRAEDDLEARQHASKFAMELEETLELRRLVTPFAEDPAVRRIAENLSDDDLAKRFTTRSGANGESDFGRKMRGEIAEYVRRKGCPEGWDFESFVAFWRLVFTVAICNEFERRVSRNETHNSAPVKELIAMESGRDIRLGNLGKLAAAGLKVPQSCAGGFNNIREEVQEAESIACESVWESVHCFVEQEPPAGDPKFLLALLRGELNKVIARARDKVRTRVERELARGETELARSERLDDGDALAGAGEDWMDPNSTIKHARGAFDGNVLLLEIINKAPDVMNLLIEYHHDGKRQAELADSMGISQSEVSKRLREARETVSRLIL